MYIFRTEIRRAIFSKKFILAIILGVLAQIIGVISMNYNNIIPLIKGNIEVELAANMFNKNMLWYFSTQVSCFSIPIICCIPFSSSLVEDKKNNYINFISIRTKHRKYIEGKIIACFISGFLAVFISTILFLLLISFSEYKDPVNNFAGFLSEVFLTKPEVYLLIYTLIVSLMGGVYSLIGLAVSTKVDSIVASTIFPAVYYLLGTYIFSMLGLVYLEPASVNAFFARPTVNGVHIFGQIVFYLIISIAFIIYNERKSNSDKKYI